MPYISPEERLELTDAIGELSTALMEIGSDSLLPLKDGISWEKMAGRLNYSISKIIHNLVEKHGESYAFYNSLIGVLECCKLEMYAQVVRKYEDGKKKINGSVSNLDKL